MHWAIFSPGGQYLPGLVVEVAPLLRGGWPWAGLFRWFHRPYAKPLFDLGALAYALLNTPRNEMRQLNRNGKA
jgi:hypothetical protein